MLKVMRPPDDAKLIPVNGSRMMLFADRNDSDTGVSSITVYLKESGHVIFANCYRERILLPSMDAIELDCFGSEWSGCSVSLLRNV